MSAQLPVVATNLSGPFALLARAGHRAARAVVGLARSIAHRREIAAMLELDDRMLKDIGLVRADVEGALAMPLTQDPSVLLRVRSVEHRARQRATEAALERMRFPVSCG